VWEAPSQALRPGTQTPPPTLGGNSYCQAHFTEEETLTQWGQRAHHGKGGFPARQVSYRAQALDATWLQVTPNTQLHPHVLMENLRHRDISHHHMHGLRLSHPFPGTSWDRRGFLSLCLTPPAVALGVGMASVVSGSCPLPRKAKKAQTKAGSGEPRRPTPDVAGSFSVPDPEPTPAQATFQGDSACGQRGRRRLYFRPAVSGLAHGHSHCLRHCQAQGWA
jgi:hypothetical protein